MVTRVIHCTRCKRAPAGGPQFKSPKIILKNLKSRIDNDSFSVVVPLDYSVISLYNDIPYISLESYFKINPAGARLQRVQYE